jgi:hypothetical protein
LITQAYVRYVYVLAKTMSGKGQNDAVVPQGAAVPRGAFLWPNREQPSSSCRGRRAPSGHQLRHAPMSRVNLDQRRTYAVGHGCARTSGRDQGLPGDASHLVGPAAPDMSQDSASFVLGLTSPGAGRQPRTWRSRTRASVSDYYLACGGARRRPSITVDWTAARWKRRHRRDPCAAHRPRRRKPPRCASRSTGQADAVHYRPTPADRTLPRRA